MKKRIVLIPLLSLIKNSSVRSFVRGSDDRTIINTREISVITDIYVVSMLVSLFSL